MKNNVNLKMDVSYIKTIMTKSQFSFEQGAKFFIIMGLYFFVLNIIPNIFQNKINGFADMYFERLINLGLEIVLLIPLAVIIGIFYKKEKMNYTNMSLWLYEICAFTIVTCTIITPIITLPNITDNIIADIFSVIGVSICMFICGKFLQNRKIIITAVLYFGGISIIMFLLGFFVVIVQAQIVNMNIAWINLYLYATTILNIFCAPIGYVVLGIEIYLDKKSRIEKNEI